MKKKKILIGLFLSFCFFLQNGSMVKAVGSCTKEKFGGDSLTVDIEPNHFDLDTINSISVNVTFEKDNLPNGKYRAVSWNNTAFENYGMGTSEWQNKGDETNSFNFVLNDDFSLGKAGLDRIGRHVVFLGKEGNQYNEIQWCKLGTYKIVESNIASSCSFQFKQVRNEEQCFGSQEGGGGCLEIVGGENVSEIAIIVEGLTINGEPFTKDDSTALGADLWFIMGREGGGAATDLLGFISDPGKAYTVFQPSNQGIFNVKVKKRKLPGNLFCESEDIEVKNNCSECQTEPITVSGEHPDDPAAQQSFNLCKQVPEESRGACTDCYSDDGLWTSLGCISRTSTKDIVNKLMTIGISVAGGIALLMILAAAFILSTSEGEPKRTSEAKEMLTHAIIGLLFIIFSITILEFIGVKILHIPEFGG